MSTHNVPFFNIKTIITLNYPRSAAKGFLFLETQARVRNSRGKRAISVRATEILQYSVPVKGKNCIKQAPVVSNQILIIH